MWTWCPCENQCAQFVKPLKTRALAHMRMHERAPLVAKIDADFDDVLAASGIELPAMYLTETRRWLVLVLFAILNALSGGPITMLPVLEPILLKEGVFKGYGQGVDMSALFSVSIGGLMVSMLVVGILYDTYGPRWNAVVLTLMFAVCAMIVGFALYIESCNWLLFIFYPLALIFSYGGNYGAYGWQWLLPESQNTVNSVLTATQALSDGAVLIIVWLYNAYGVQLWTYFWFLALFGLCTALLNSLIVPSQKDHLSYAKAVLPFLIAKASNRIDETSGVTNTLDGNYGSSGNVDSFRVVNDIAIETSGWRWWDNVKGVRNTFLNIPSVHLFFCGGCCCLYTSVYIPVIQMYPLFSARFGVSNALALLKDFSLIYGIGGAVFAIFGGRFCDWLGIKWTMAFTLVLSILGAIALAIPTVSSQLVWLGILTVQISMVNILVYRFCMLYAPVQLFGTYTGVVFVLMGVFEILASWAFSALLANVSGSSSKDQTHVEVWCTLASTYFLTLLLALCWVSTFIYWQWYPPPAVGSISCRDAGIPEYTDFEFHTGTSETEC